MKRLIEIDDVLPDRLYCLIHDFKCLVSEYFSDNGDEEKPEWSDLDYSGSVHELVDLSVPIYTKQIDDIWYLYKNELESVYENAGIGGSPLENDGMTAIYLYLEQELSEWWHGEDGDNFWDNLVKTKGSQG